MKRAASVANAAAVNPSGTRTILANGVCTYFIKVEPTFINLVLTPLQPS